MSEPRDKARVHDLHLDDEEFSRLVIDGHRQHAARELRRAADDLRATCKACGGTGRVGGGIHCVEGQDLAGNPTEVEYEEPPTECEYCGRPMRLFRARAAALDPEGA